MELTKEQKLRPAIETLEIGGFIDLPKDDFTASAARQAVNRVSHSDSSEENQCRKFQVSETAYPGGTRVTRLA